MTLTNGIKIPTLQIEVPNKIKVGVFAKSGEGNKRV